ncbi:MAG: type II toxin-antitoxin system mRNA interferase toxin, RelE/StbE family [bacterium]|nr:type II toxin-antitoxin system mRNA interferase toxin, RelE/StbE family [bacterium]
MKIAYTPSFLRSLKKLPDELQEEAIEKIELLSSVKNHESLKVHKLKAELSGRYSFSVNYKTRIVFRLLGKPPQALLLAIGDHDIYK